MRVSDLRVGTSLLNGRIFVIHLKRRGAYSDIELTDGKGIMRTTLHKSQSIMTVLAGVMAAGGSSGSFTQHSRIMASSPIWRGERTYDTLPHGEVTRKA